MAEYSILKLRLQQERHVVNARQRARDIAEQLGFDRQDQVRVATATSELTRNAFRYAREGEVEFSVTTNVPQALLISVRDKGAGIPQLDAILAGTYVSKTGMGKGLTGTQRLMDSFRIESNQGGTSVSVSKVLPPNSRPIDAAVVRVLVATLAKAEVDPFQEVERQNQELLTTLSELNEKQKLLAQVNTELEDTNRGVVALYAELEQTANDLRRVSDQKTSFLSNLSHEFRTPLNSILALCQILTNRSDGELTGEQEKQVGYIRKSAADLSELVNDLLDVAKVEAGRIDIKPAIFSVADVFAALRGMLRTLVTGPAVQLVFSEATSLPPLFSDEQKLAQILRNLISNALKFTERGQVTVSAAKTGDDIEFQVSDTGIGVAAADQRRIFEEFVQINSDIQNRVRGTGLGLPLSRKLAELLGGTLTVASELGEGSTFTLTLPAQYVEVDLVRQTAVDSQRLGPRVLIVEDNMETRFIHSAALKHTPYTLLFCRDVKEALAAVQAEAPVAIVLDRMLDGEDSLPFLVSLREGGYVGKVIVVSVVDDAQPALQAGADAFLAKPIAHGLLAGTVVALLDNKRVKTLLLVDDDEINRYVLRDALMPFGFTMIEARTGREAIDLAVRTNIDGIFLDMSMPGLTGAETLRELRALAGTRKIPVVVHTSKDLTGDEVSALQALDANFFPKKQLAETNAYHALRAVLEKEGLL